MKRLLLLLALGGCASKSAPPPALAAAAAARPTTPDKGPDLSYWEHRKDLLGPPPPPQPRPLELPRVERWKLKNGLEVIVVPRAELPAVSFGVAIKAGGYDEQRSSLGVSSFTAEMLRKGTKRSNADQISQLIDGVGGSFDATAASEHTGVSCTVLAKDRGVCFRLLAETLLTPTFPEAEMGEIRDRMLGGINQRYDDPGSLAGAHFAARLFGDQHPDGWVLMPEDVRRITRADLVKFWKTYYRPNNSLLVMAGDVGDLGALRARIEKDLGSWQGGPVPARPEFRIPEHKGTRTLLVDKEDLTQTTLVFGHAGIRHTDPAWYGVTLMNYVLGGSDFSSRLMREVRSRRGLTYGISSSFGDSFYQGAFEVSAATKNESAWDAFAASVAEIRRMKAEGPTAEEVNKAHGYYAGSYPFQLQSAPSVASSIVGAELHGLGVAYVKELAVRLGEVDAAAARAAAVTYLHPDDLTVVIVGRGEAVAPQLQKAGVKFERIGYRDPFNAAAAR
ncbi:MAG TPA: pitrilysin family protein [Polyangia bacterium]|nr:pitrilysin family protein [Polyangia bacterium]